MPDFAFPSASKGQVIGLLGGSFNPAHGGHLHLSEEALKRLKLDAVWWLVTPRNPLKKKEDLGDYAERLSGAADVAAHPRIRVTALEQRLGTRYTVDTLAALKRLYPGVTFIWLMGADNLAGFHRWRKWPEVFKKTPIAIFDRAPYSHSSLRAKAALRFGHSRKNARHFSAEALKSTPAWAYIPIRRDPTSATEIRKTLG